MIQPQDQAPDQGGKALRQILGSADDTAANGICRTRPPAPLDGVVAHQPDDPADDLFPTAGLRAGTAGIQVID